MGNKLFIGNLSWNVNDEQLKEVFSAIGTVEEAVVITDRIKNRSKGFGFVKMSTPEEAQKAIEELNGKEVDGRPMNVSEAREEAPRERRPFNRDNYNRDDNRRSFDRR
jgi:RNA recognition motif-containing protein